MRSLGFLLSWGVLLQILAVLHFIRRRPDTYWLFVIIFFGPLGAIIYIVMEVVPDLGMLRQSFEMFPRRKRIRLLEGIVQENPSTGNYEELGELYLDEGKFAKARECYDKAIGKQGDLADTFYRRGIAEIQLGDFAAAVNDLEHIVSRDPKYDSHRAAGLLAHAYANAKRYEEAEALFRQVTDRSTTSETYYNYAVFLAAQNRIAEAREWAQKILAKKAAMPGYLKRRERPWFRSAKTLLARLTVSRQPKAGSPG